MVGLGNKLDVDESEVLEYLGEDEETKAIFVYLERLQEAQAFSLRWPKRSPGETSSSF